MFGSTNRQDDTYILEALHKSQAIIEFKPDGTILTANENFLSTLGYALGEIEGKHHSMFVPREVRDGEAYKAFWPSLARGEFQSDQFRRVTRDGRDIYIQATYNPVRDRSGKVVKVVKIASDITEQAMRDRDLAGQVEAISRAQAVIEFQLDGTIIRANDNFLSAMGYSLDEVAGKHHSIFVDSSDRNTADYRAFWDSLNAGEFKSAEFRRIAKGGREIWIQASYNPIFGIDGKPYKVVKFATDITAMVKERQRRSEAIGQIAEQIATIAAAATQSSGQAESAADATGSATENVQAVASACEELASSIQEISRQVADSNAMSADAVEKAKQTAAIMDELESSAQSIGEVLKLITDIAE